MREPDTQYKQLITCPWCGYENKDSWEADHDFESEAECGRCEKEFTYLADISVTWSTWKKETPNR